MLRSGAGFVNLAQQVRFLRPIKLFIRVGVATRLLYADDKRAYFLHALHSRGTLAAEVLVKRKFKRGGRTLEPSTLSCLQLRRSAAAGAQLGVGAAGSVTQANAPDFGVIYPRTWPSGAMHTVIIYP